MSSADFNIESADLEKLNDKDKTELRQFFQNEEQRARIQSRMPLPHSPSSQFPSSRFLHLPAQLNYPLCSASHSSINQARTNYRRLLKKG